MPSPEVNIIQQLAKAIQYTGSNSADLVAQVPGVNGIISEGPSQVVLDFNGSAMLVPIHNWVQFSFFLTQVLTEAQYANEWGCVAVCSDIESLQAVSSVGAMGTAAVPALPPGQDAIIAVQLQPAMPSSSYSPHALAFGGVNLGDLSITSVSVVDADTVNVAVDNVGALTVSDVTVLVHAIS